MHRATTPCGSRRWTTAALGVLAFAALAAVLQAQTAVSDRADHPFRLATFEAAGNTRLGMVLGTRVLEIERANQHVAREAGLARVEIPGEMRALIEQYGRVAPRLYQIANYFKSRPTTGLAFAFDADKVAFKAPIKYPWNVLAAAANYKAHAEGMGAAGAAGAPPPQAGAGGQPAQQGGGGARGGFNPAVIAQIVPERDGPIMFAKSPRSTIIDPNEPYYIKPGRNVDWEGEMAIVIGREAYGVSSAAAHEYVFGYSIMYDVSDRGGTPPRRVVNMFPGPNWFDGKSTDRGGPFGPVIVPKEFLPNAPGNLRVVTRVNGVVKQDQSTADLIWNEAHLIRYLTSILTLYPGDVIATGTPAGTGAERNEFLKPGDVVEIEIEGIGTLRTPMKAESERPRRPSSM